MASRSPRINCYDAKGNIKPIARQWEEILRVPICRKFHPKILVNSWNNNYNDLRLERGNIFISIVRQPESDTFSISTGGISIIQENFKPVSSSADCIEFLKQILKQRL